MKLENVPKQEMPTMRSVALMSTALLGSAAAAAAGVVPTGAKIEASGFATIASAPPVPYSDEPPPAENLAPTPDEWYARENGISVEEAQRRTREQQALRPVLERLITRLKESQPGNFVGAKVVHKPDWAYVLYFKREPERTLAQYMRYPRFKAAAGGLTEAELRSLAQPWLDRFSAQKIARVWGMRATEGTVEIGLSVSETEYRAIAAREGWGPVPKEIVLGFAGSLPQRAIAEAVKPFVRIFPQNDRAAGFQPERGEYGRITMRDGCLYTGKALAYFHHETGLGVDDQGYLALTDRRSGKSKGRIGEWFSWAGPNSFNEEMPMVQELRQRCGDAPIYHVGNPSSAAQDRVKGHVVDNIARRRKVSRERAWALLKQCWRRSDAAKPNAPPDDMSCLS